MITDRSKHQILDYDIAGCSTSQVNYGPENIKIDSPANSNSRWTATSNDRDQYILLKLKRPSLITAITFGKYQKLHISNIKDVAIYSYNDLQDLPIDHEEHTNIKRKNDLQDFPIDHEEHTNIKEKNDCFMNCEKGDNQKNTKLDLIKNLPKNNENFSLNNFPYTNTKEKPVLVFEGVMNNDSLYETFPLKNIHKNMFVISRYIKIKPLQAWGINMNCCVWFVNLHGIDEKDFLYNMIKHNYNLITSECYKIVYNFLKKENKIKTLNVLQKEANLHTESDIVKNIRKLVHSEDFDGLEELFSIALKRNLINRKEYLVGKWTRITNVNEPKPRGGHAMASFEDKLFLHGGWDGTEELNDFWVFDCTTETWTKKDINLQTRSCHKMTVFYSKRFEDEIRREMVEKELKDENFNDYKKRDFPESDYKNLNDVINTNFIENRNIQRNEINNNLVFDQKIGEKNNDLMNKKNIIIDKEGFDKDQYVLKNGNNKQSSLEPYLIVIGKYVQKEKNPQKMDISIHNIKRNLTFLVDYYGEMENIYDHQLATNSHEIYMMGGRTIAPRSCEYGGLYEFKNKNFIRLDTTKNIDLQERVAHNLIYYENYKYLDINEFKNSGNSDLFNIKKFDDNSKDYNKKNDSENEQKNSHFDDKTLNQKHMMPDHKNNRQKESVHLQNSNPKDSNYLEDKSKNNYSFEKQNDFMQNNKNSSKNLNHFFIAKKNLIIIGGYKERSHYADISFFDLDSKTVYKRVPFPKKHNGKILSRCELIDDFLVLYLSYENSKTSLYESSELYQYDILNDKWLKLNVSPSFPNARSAHSFTYNKETNSLYVFGGNVSDKNTQSRNNEMWKLNIQGIDDNSMMNKIRFCIRKYKFISLIDKDLRNALTFLQNDVYDVVDHENIYEEKIFKKIVLELYKEERRLNNEEIVQELCKFLIDDLKIESKNLFEMLE